MSLHRDRKLALNPEEVKSTPFIFIYSVHSENGCVYGFLKVARNQALYEALTA